MKWMPIPDAASVEMRWIARLIDSIGTPGMDHAMLEAVNDLVPVEEVCGFLIADTSQPFGNCGRRADSDRRAKLYAELFFRKDPLRAELTGTLLPGQMLVRTDTAAGIADDRYRWECFDDPRFGSRVSIVRTNPGGWSMIQFYLSEKCPAEQTVSELARFSIAAFPAARRHFDLPDWDHRGGRASASDGIEAKLATRFPTLSTREREVCALTMAGSNSRQIAARMGVAASTVLTYRRRAYERLGISSAGELVGSVMS